MNILYRISKFSLLIVALFSVQNSYSQEGRLPTKQELDTKYALEAVYRSQNYALTGNISGKHLLVSQPEQDCAGAIPLCSPNIPAVPTSYIGHGNIQEVNGTCLSGGETNSRWYVFTVQNAGTLGFMINTANDYDFALYDLGTSGDCSIVPSSTPIRCNYSATYGNTGLTLPTQAGNLSYNAGQAPTMPGINALYLHTYALIVDNYSANSNGFSMTFSGTATIADNTPPHILSSSIPCNSNSFSITTDEGIDCGSVTLSDFTITGPSGNVPVVSTSTCSSTALTTNVSVNYNNAGLTTGVYTINIVSGSDGNTFIDKCGNLLAPTSFTFAYLAPISISASTSTVCAGGTSTLTINGTGGTPGITYNWSPISATTNSLVVNPTVNTTYNVTASFGSCTKSASTYISITLPPVVSVNPTNVSLCSGTTNIIASATSGSSPCLNCNYTWSGSSTQVDNAVSSSTITGAGAGSYSVSVTSADGCVGNTAVSNVSILSPAASPACNIVYASPAGGGTGLTPGSPTDIQTALTMAACNAIVIKMQIGDYTINNPLNINSFVTIEGGYDVGFTTKTSAKATTGGFPAQGTRIIRSIANPEGTAANLRYTALNVSPSSSYFRLQDLRIEMPVNTDSLGKSNYGIYLGAGCNNYNITRCYINSGTAGPGKRGARGPNGANGVAGANGSNASLNYTSPAGNSGAGGLGGGPTGGAGGAGVNYSGAGAPQTGNNGITQSSAQGGGGGASGGTGVRNATSAVAGAAGGTGFTGAAGGAGGTGSSINTSSGCGFSFATMAGGNGTNGGAGAAGVAPGAAPAGSSASGLWVTATGAIGAPGAGGNGGGGGGGGQGAFGGAGGTGGGSAFGIFIFNNGANGNVVDCQLIPGVAGVGGFGGPGGNGGSGGTGGAGGSRLSVYVGNGGNGGAGGAGGAGGQGVSGSAGTTATLLLVGGSPLATNTTINMLGQPVITVDNKACTNVNISHATAAGTPNWTSFGTGATPGSGAGSPVNTVYSTLGRKTVVMNANNYTDFNNIIVNPPSTGSIVASAVAICPGSANFASTAVGTSGLNYSWSVLPAGATISSASTSSTSISFANTGSTPITYTVTLTINSNCCGNLIPVTTTIVVNPIPATPTATVNPACVGGVATYTATSPVGSGFNWYNAASSGTLLASGTTYSVANISGPNTVYLQAINSAGCTSTIVSVAVTPTAVMPPTVIPGSACDIGSVQVGINPVTGATDYSWYSDAGGTTLVQSGTSLDYNQNIGTAGGTYTVYVKTNVAGCASSSLVPVTGSVSSTPITLANTITPNDTVCANTVVTFSLNPGGGNGTYTYTWSPFSSTSNTATQTYTASESVNVTITSNGCSKLFYLPIIVNPNPKDSIGTPMAISCTSQSVTLDGSFSDSGANITYSWTTGGGNILTSPTLNSIGVDAAGTYSLIVTNTVTGCSSLQSVNVNGSSALPTVTVSPTAYTLTCATPSVQLNATSTTSGVTYSWATLSGVLSATNISNPVATSSGTYIVSVTNPTTSCVSSETLIIVPDAAIPTATISSTSAVINCSASVQSATVTTTPSSNITYAWNPSPASGAGTSTPTFSAQGTYSCLITNTTNSCTTSAQIVITTDTVRPVISLTPSQEITCTTPSVTINSTVTPSTGITYAWGGSGIISTANADSIDVNSGGNYSLTVTDGANGCASTQTVSITDNTALPTVTVTPVNYTLTCVTPTVQLNASTTASDVNYSWTTVGGVLSATNISNPVASSSGVYSVVVTNSLTGCQSSGSLTIVPDAAAPTATLSATNANINCAITVQSTTLSTTPSSNMSYSWSPAPASGGSSSTPTFSTAGTYSCLITNLTNSCTTTAQIVIGTDTVRPVISVTSSATISCTTPSVTINSTVTTPTSGVTYSWSGAGIIGSSTSNTADVNAIGNYTLTVSDAVNGCTATAVSNIISNSSVPTITLTSSSTTISCTAPTVTLSASTGAGNTIIWTTSTATLTNPALATAPDNYTVTIIDGTSGCRISQPVNVTGSTTNPGASIASTVMPCGSSSVLLSGSTTSTNSVTYSWSGPGTITNGSTANPTVNQIGVYSFSVTDNTNGCVSTNTLNVIQGNVTAAFTADPSTGESPLTVNFTDHSIGAVNYNWNFGDVSNNISTSANPTHVYTTGTYTATLIVSSGICTDTMYTVIVVEDAFSIEIPNVFTPNGDGSNDVFTIKSTGVKEISLQIFNRWGQKLHELTGPKASWDGLTPSGTVASEGTYFYFVKAKGFDDKEFDQHGTVNLFR